MRRGRQSQGYREDKKRREGSRRSVGCEESASGIIWYNRKSYIFIRQAIFIQYDLTITLISIYAHLNSERVFAPASRTKTLSPGMHSGRRLSLTMTSPL